MNKKNLLLMFGFGILSAIFGKIQFTIPGIEGIVTDLREVIIFISVIYIPNWIYLIGISILTSLSTPPDGSILTTIIMHICSSISAFVVYKYWIKKIENVYLAGILWCIMIVVNYLGILLPSMIFSNLLMEMIKKENLVTSYFFVVNSTIYELIFTSIISAFYLSSHKLKKMLKANNNELIEAKEKAEQSDKLKSEFLAQISHEIRTPLNSMLSFSNYLRESLLEKLDQDQLMSFSSIDQSGKRIIRTTELVLNMSQMITNSYENNSREIDLFDDILSDIIVEYKIIATAKAIKLIHECNSQDLLIDIDEYTTQQIFTNLIDNAVKFTDTGEVKIVIDKDNMGLFVTVEDTGIGISEKFLPKVFDPFLQEEQGYTRSFDGIGLGLALAKKCCEINNAVINVESIKNKGSKFTVSFLSPSVKRKQPIKTLS